MRAIAILAALFWVAVASANDVRLADAQYPEGGLWHDGRLYYAEMARDAVVVSDLKTVAPFWQMAGCGPVSIAPYRADEFVILCHLQHKLVRVSKRGETVAVIDRDRRGKRFVYPNTASADDAGGVYFSSSGTFSRSAPATGAVLYLDAKGRVKRLAEGIHYANGVAFDGARKRLLVSAHLARQVLSFPILDLGKLGKRRVFFDFASAGIERGNYPLSGPDGLELTPDGDVLVPEYGAGRVLRISAEGVWLGIQFGFEQFVTDVTVLPGGRAAVTAARVNDAPPYQGHVLLRDDFLNSFVK